MEVAKIIEQVRLCIDEQKLNEDYASQGMDNIIKGKMDDALRWCCMYAEGSMLGGTDAEGSMLGGTDAEGSMLGGTDAEGSMLGGTDAESGTSVVMKDYTITNGTAPSGITYSDGVIELPSGFMKLVRVKVDGWHKAVMNPIEEDSEAYLMVHDDTAGATAERPQVAIIQGASQKLELFPKPETGFTGKIELSVVVNPAGGTTGTGTNEAFAVPPRVKGAFIYYLAFLVLSAYGDSRAQAMLGIARMELGVQGT